MFSLVNYYNKMYTSNTGEGVEKREPSYTLGRNGKQCGGFSEY